jgi:hypothetical protein
MQSFETFRSAFGGLTKELIALAVGQTDATRRLPKEA